MVNRYCIRCFIYLYLYSLTKQKTPAMFSFQKKHLYLILALLSITASLRSQSSFSITLKDSTYDDQVYDAIELSNGQFIIAAMRTVQPNNYEAIIIKIDAQGKLIHEKILRYNGQSSKLVSIIQLSENRFILSGTTYISGNIEMSGNFWLCTLDSSLNVVDEKNYDLGYKSPISKMILDSQHNILIYGTVLDKNAPPYMADEIMFIFKLTSVMDSLNFKTYYGAFFIGEDLIEKSDHKGYYFLAYSYYTFNGSFAHILDLEAGLSCKRTIDIPLMIGDLGTIKLVDSTHFMISAEELPANDSMSYKIGVLLYDTAFNLLHFREYGKADTNDYPAVKSLDFSDATSVFIGGTSYVLPNEFSQADNWFRLNNIDTVINVKWERFYGGDGYYSLFGILATRDGGCLMYGTIWDFHNNPDQTRYLRLIKVSKDGLLSDENGKPRDKAKEVILYPNPGNDRIIVQTTLQGLTVSFFDVAGNCVAKKTIHSMVESLDVSELSTGIYFYRFTCGDKVIDCGKWIKK